MRGDKTQFLRQVIQFANRYLYELALDDELLSGMATTLAVILVERKTATIAHVGDSRVYRLVEGKLHRETVDHSLAEDIRYGSLSGHVNKNIITRALGIESEVEPEFKSVPLSPGATFLLCTDGITRHISDDELTEVLATTEDPQEVCDQLKDLCYERGARDNLTAVVVKLESGTGFNRAVEQETQPSSRPTQKLSRKGQTARIQVKLEERGETNTEFQEIDRSISPEQNQMTFSSQLTQSEEPVAPKRVGRFFSALILVAALAGSFVGGVYFQRSFSTDWFAWLTDKTGAPAQQRFDEGRRSFEAGRYAEAQRAFQESVSMSPTTAVYHHWLGRAQLNMKQYQEAARSFEKAAASGAAAENYLYAAAAYEAAGEKQRAEELLAAYLKAAR
jgi:protein phosphatase